MFGENNRTSVLGNGQALCHVLKTEHRPRHGSYAYKPLPGNKIDIFITTFTIVLNDLKVLYFATSHTIVYILQVKNSRLKKMK